jgi:hypothetical protein
MVPRGGTMLSKRGIMIVMEMMTTIQERGGE